MEHFAQTDMFARIRTDFAHLIIGCVIRYPKTGNLRYRFNVYLTKVIKIFHRRVDIMAMNLKPLIYFPEKDMNHMIISHKPKCFKPQYSRVTCIIDCFEVFIQRPTSFIARAQTYSNYKGLNIIKFLVAITATGATYMFLFQDAGVMCFGQKFNCKLWLLQSLNYGDMVIADQGFGIANKLACIGATYKISPFI